MGRTPYRSVLAAVIVAWLAFFSDMAHLDAQTGRASITGVVRDVSGGVIPGVEVTVTDIARGVTFKTETNATGLYTATRLLVSTYKVTASKPGFKTYVLDSFPLTAEQSAVLDITLMLGSTKQQVVVTSQVQMLQPSNATLGGLVNNALIEDLPTYSRNVLTLLPTVAGVMPTSPNSYEATNDPNGDTMYSLNGSTESQSEYLLDGLSIEVAEGGPAADAVSVYPSMESIQDIRVQTNEFSADYGRTGGGIVTMVSKSGTNQFHGDAYDYLRNNALDANGFFSNASHSPIPPLAYNDYGFTLGGPIVKNKTFGFVSLERVVDHAGAFTLMTLPTAAERNGDFSQDLNAEGQKIVVYNPFSTVPNPAAPGTYIRTAFPNNRIPASLMDPVAVKAESFVPATNLPGTPIPGTSEYTPVNDFGVSKAASSPFNEIDARVDHDFSSTKRLFARYTYSDLVFGSPDWYSNVATPNGASLQALGYNAELGYTQSFGSATVLDLRAGYDRFGWLRGAFGLGYNLTDLGLPASLATYSELGGVEQFPQFYINGYQQIGAGSYFYNWNNDYTFSASLMHVIGRHSLEVGASSISYLMNVFVDFDTFSGNFGNDMTQGPNPLTVSTTDGDAYASFLLGTADSGATTDNAATANGSHYFAQYVQDTFKVTPKFTLDPGFRLEEETGTTERFNRLVAINPSIENPISKQVGFPVHGAYEFAGSGPDSFGRRAIRPMEFRPNPRIGLAYMLGDKTVIRAGYGIFYGIPSTDAQPGFTGTTYTTSTPWLATLNNGITPNYLLNNPFPQGYTYPPGRSLGELSALGLALSSGLPQSLHDEYNQQWNFTVQRSINPNLMLQVAYAGNKGTHLPLDVEYDQLPLKDESQGGSLLTGVPNPFYGYITTGPYSEPTVEEGLLETPYPGWDGVDAPGANATNSNYNALQVMLQKRFAGGNTFTVSYTWSKLMADGFDGIWTSLSTIPNWYCRECYYSPAAFDTPQRIVMSGVVELPFGPGKRFGSSWKGITNAVLGGWQANGILTLASGQPLAFSSIGNSYSFFGGGQLPDLTGTNPNAPHQSINEWFNPSALAIPPNFTFGNMDLTYTPVRTDWTRDLDFSLFKNFRITERLKLQFRAEAYNFTNVPIFGAPNTTVGSTGFGTIGYQANSSRTFQLALKFMF